MILIVEDNTVFRTSLKEVLSRRFPHETILEASDGKEALERVDTLAPSLVFMDIRLPGANGLELTRTITKNYRDIVVIVLTSHDLPEYRDAAYRSGASHFLTKGIATSEEIMTLVESTLSTMPAEARA